MGRIVGVREESRHLRPGGGGQERQNSLKFPTKFATIACLLSNLLFDQVKFPAKWQLMVFGRGSALAQTAGVGDTFG